MVPRQLQPQSGTGLPMPGMCTSSIASASGLRFVPVAHEDYELAVRREMLKDPRIPNAHIAHPVPAYRAILGKDRGL